MNPLAQYPISVNLPLKWFTSFDLFKHLSFTKLESSLKEKTNELPYPLLDPPSDYHGISVYAPKILPISDLKIVKVGP